MKIKIQRNFKSTLMKGFMLLMFGMIGEVSWGQTTYDWLNTAPDGNWTQGASGARWTGGLYDNPSSGSGTRLQFNNNQFPNMTNNVSAGYVIGQLFFGSSATTSRTIGGNSVQFFEFGSTWPRIENLSTTLHTINFPFLASSNPGFNMELVASSGNIDFGGTINNNGRIIQIYGNNTAVDATIRAIRLGGVVSGTGALNVSKFGTVKLIASHTYTGQTQIDNGELWIESAGSIASGSAIFVGNGGQLTNVAKFWISNGSGGTTVSNAITINNGNTTTRYLGGLNTSGTNTFSGNITNNSTTGGLYLSAFSSGGTTTFSGVISGSGSVLKDGAGTVILTNTNTYSGITTLSAGTLSIANNTSLGSGSLTIGNGSTTGTLAITTSTIRSLGIVVNNTSSAAVIDVASGQTFTLEGVLSGGATNTTKFGKSGSGTITLTGTATYNGQLQLGDGTVIANNITAISTNITTNARGVDLGLNVGDVSTTNNVSLLANNGFTVGNSIYVATNESSATRTIGLNGSGSATFSNEIYLDGNLTASGGSGTVTLGGRLTNTGGIIASEGIVTLTASTNNFSGMSTVNSGAELRLNPAANATFASQIVLSGGTLSTTGITATRTFTSSSTLNLTASTASTIALGTGNHTLTFANSSSLTPWGASATLTITGWGGTAGETNTNGGKIFVGVGGLTNTQLSKISFTGFHGAPIILGTGELVPQSPLITYSNTQFTTARDITRGTTELPIYRFQVNVATVNTTLSSLAFTTPDDNINNSYVSTDITNFKAFLTTSTTFSNATQLGATDFSGKILTTGGEIGISFTTNTTLNVGTTYYIWLTADVLNGATSGRTIIVNAPTVGITGTVSGTNSATGVQTIISGAITQVYFKASPSSTSALDPSNWSYNVNGSAGNIFTGAINDYDVTWNIRNSNATQAGTWTLGNNSKVIVGDGTNANSFTINSGVLTGSVDVADAGILSILSSTIPTLGTLGSTSSTVVYGASGAQTIQDKTYANLNIGGSGIKTIGTTTVIGTLTQSGSATLGTASPTLTGATLAYVDATSSQAYTAGLEWPSSNGPSNVTVNLSGTGNPSLTLSGTRSISGSLTLTAGKLAIGAGNTLTLNGGLTCDATNSLISTATSNITLTGATKTLYFDASNNTLKNLAITGSSTMTLGNALNITGGSSFGVVTVGTGATLATGGNLTLKSIDLGTACIGTSLGTVSGSVSVERYISSAGRRWRFLSSPVQSATVANWMTKFYVTGPDAGTNSGLGNALPTTGWHCSQANINYPSTGSDYRRVQTTSIRTYNESASGNNTNINSGWENLTGTSQALTPGQGFRVFVRGPIGNTGQLDGSVTSQSEVTLALNGTVNQGSITLNSGSSFPITNATQGWNLIGNPYPCAYDIAAHYTGNSNSLGANCSTSVYIYNPTAGTAGYAGFNSNGNASSGTGLSTGIIPSGGAFFIRANGGSPTFTFQEVYKTTTAPSGLHKTSVNDQFEIKYSKDTVESDYLTVKMYNGATLNYDAFDILKIRNDNLNLAAYGEDTMQVSASVIQPVVSETRIKLNVEATEIATYNFDFKNMDNFDAGVTVHLFDRYTNKTTDVKANTKYTFDMGAGVNQWGKNRFELILNLDKTGVDEFALLNQTQMLVYPNPATDVLNINISNSSFKNSEVMVYNISGAEVLKTNIEKTNAQLNIETLSNGVYFVKVTNQNGFNKTVKFVK
ncbi:MAG: T9SS type A sorting domain-containing protein [Bacteroidia bacterium]